MKLVPQTRVHADALFPILNDDRLYTFIGGNPLTTVDALRERYTRLESRVSPDEKSRWLNWVIEVEGATVGTVQATVAGDEAFLAWVVGTAWQGRGYASEAVTMLVAELGFQNVATFKAQIHPKNIASQRIAQKLGMAKTKKLVDGEELWTTR